MPTRRPSPEHQAAVSRRLAQLSAELEGVRPEPGPTRDRAVEGPAFAAPPPADDLLAHTRVRVRPRGPEDVAAEAVPMPEQPPLVPRPGRHAARRLRRTVADTVPDTLRGRAALGPPQVALVAVLVAAGLAVTTWWVVRGDARPVAAPVLTGTPAAGLATPAPPPDAGHAPSATATAGGRVTVDVAGKVRRPGIAVLDAGARVVDALRAAGGAQPGADLTSLNLARLLVDGEQILVGVPVPVGVGSVGAGPSPAPAAPAALVNLNTAGMAELETLPDVGPVTAEAIIAWRTEHGGFTSVDELLEVDGIGDATLETIAPHVTV